MKKTIVMSAFMTALTAIPLASNAAPAIPASIDALALNPGLQMKKPELENIFELPKGSLTGKSFNGVKKLFQEGLNVAVAESRFLQVDEQGKVSGLFGKVDAKTKKVQIYVDYGRYKIDQKATGEEQKIGYLMRLEAEITNFEAGADISSLFAVGFAAKTGKIQGKIRVLTIGLSGSSLDQYVTTATSISEESLLKAIENMAILKSKINSDEITINPDRLPVGI